MPKSQYVDPGKVFEPGYIDFDSIPLCRYNKTIEEEKANYSNADFMRIYRDMGIIREFFGNGSLFGIPILSNFMDPILIFILPPGGFFVFGLLIALVNLFTKGKAIKKKDFGCEGCPSAGACGKLANGGSCSAAAAGKVATE